MDMISSNIAMYLITAILTVLFLLQLWAIFRIKEMLRQVTEIFRFVRAGTLASKYNFRRFDATPDRICENCRFRKTYFSNEPKFEIYFHCKKHDKPIALNETCHLFELDEQNKET